MTDIGTIVAIRPKCREDDAHAAGTVVGGSLWQSYATGEPTGDRLIEFADGLRLYYAPWMFTVKVAPRARQCGHVYGGDGRWRYACTLYVDHGGEEHEDHSTEAPTVYAWIRPELISNPRGLPIMRTAPQVLVSA